MATWPSTRVFGQTEKDAGRYTESLAAEMLAIKLGRSFDGRPPGGRTSTLPPFGNDVGNGDQHYPDRHGERGRGRSGHRGRRFRDLI